MADESATPQKKTYTNKNIRKWRAVSMVCGLTSSWQQWVTDNKTKQANEPSGWAPSWLKDPKKTAKMPPSTKQDNSMEDGTPDEKVQKTSETVEIAKDVTEKTTESAPSTKQDNSTEDVTPDENVQKTCEMVEVANHITEKTVEISPLTKQDNSMEGGTPDEKVQKTFETVEIAITEKTVKMVSSTNQDNASEDVTPDEKVQKTFETEVAKHITENTTEIAPSTKQDNSANDVTPDEKVRKTSETIEIAKDIMEKTAKIAPSTIQDNSAEDGTPDEKVQTIFETVEVAEGITEKTAKMAPSTIQDNSAEDVTPDGKFQKTSETVEIAKDITEKTVKMVFSTNQDNASEDVTPDEKVQKTSETVDVAKHITEKTTEIASSAKQDNLMEGGTPDEKVQKTSMSVEVSKDVTEKTVNMAPSTEQDNASENVTPDEKVQTTSKTVEVDKASPIKTKHVEKTVTSAAKKKSVGIGQLTVKITKETTPSNEEIDTLLKKKSSPTRSGKCSNTVSPLTTSWKQTDRTATDGTEVKDGQSFGPEGKREQSDAKDIETDRREELEEGEQREREKEESWVKIKRPAVTVFRKEVEDANKINALSKSYSAVGSLKSRWQSWASEHTVSQKLNPFSEYFDHDYSMSTRLQRGQEGYGRPREGTKTAERARRAEQHIHREIDDMCLLIRTMADPGRDGRTRVTFGELFDRYVRISDKVVGILMRARKHGKVDFEGEMLWQGRDDGVVITLLV